MQKDFIYENYLKMPDDLEFEQAMKVYEELLEEAAAQNISVDENFPFHGNLKGLYVDQNIALSDQLETSAEKACILAEELGHHYTSTGDRTVMHDSVIHSLDELAAYTKEHGKEAKWREELGYQRKRIGDFACYVSLIYGVFAR